jgi:hypothetical protein
MKIVLKTVSPGGYLVILKLRIKNQFLTQQNHYIKKDDKTDIHFLIIRDICRIP